MGYFKMYLNFRNGNYLVFIILKLRKNIWFYQHCYI